MARDTEATQLKRKYWSLAILLGKEAGLIVDVGTNIGDYTAAARARFSNAEIHPFKPAAVNTAKLNS